MKAKNISLIGFLLIFEGSNYTETAFLSGDIVIGFKGTFTYTDDKISFTKTKKKDGSGWQDVPEGVPSINAYYSG